MGVPATVQPMPRNEVAVHEPEPDAMLAVIVKAAADPNTDADKMERLLAMHERLKASQAKATYLAALAEMKPELPVIDRRGRIEVREKTASGKRDGDVTQNTPYALWEDIDEAITPILAKRGFVLTFRCGVAQDGKITVTGVLGHRDGHSEETTITLPHDSTGSKNSVQAIGSSVSYGKRITATLLLNIRTKGQDDDGNLGGQGLSDTVSMEQADRILELLTRDGADVKLFCAYMGQTLKMDIARVLDIPASQYNHALEVINTRSQKVKAKGAK